MRVLLAFVLLKAAPGVIRPGGFWYPHFLFVLAVFTRPLTETMSQSVSFSDSRRPHWLLSEVGFIYHQINPFLQNKKPSLENTATRARHFPSPLFTQPELHVTPVSAQQVRSSPFPTPHPGLGPSLQSHVDVTNQKNSAMSSVAPSGDLDTGIYWAASPGQLCPQARSSHPSPTSEPWLGQEHLCIGDAIFSGQRMAWPV